MKARTAYRFTPDLDDTNPTNEIIRSDIGVNGLRSAVATSQGVVFLNTANPTEPKMHILTRNPFGDTFDARELFAHYDFSQFTYDDVLVYTWDRYVLVGCKEDSDENNRLLLCNVAADTVDKTSYGIRTATKSGGYLYGGDPVSQTSYELFTGFDDMGIALENSWTGAPNLLESTRLKKVKRMRFMGQIDPDQALKVYLSRDNGDFELVGTIRGDADYVDYNTSYAIGTSAIGVSTLGGDDDVSTYQFYMEIKLRGSKFRQRKVKFVATGIGYVEVHNITDYDIWKFSNRMPKSYRIKQNVSLDGATTDNDFATFT
jgi:hypothetical protein